MESTLFADTISIGLGLSRERDAIKAVKEAMQQARADLSKEKIDLAIVFSSIDFAHPVTIKTINSLLREVPVIGCTGVAVISDRGIFTHGLMIMLLSFSKSTSFSSVSVQDIQAKGALKAGEELGEKLLRGFHGIHRDLGIVFSDGQIKEGWNLIYGLQEKLGTSFPLIGAFASDDLRFSKSFVYLNQEVSSDAACGIIWGGKLNFGWGIKHGWKPLGKPHQVTKAKANVVYEIDGGPATKIYEEYLARNLEELKKELRRISIFYPMGIHLPSSQEYLLRNIKSIEDDGSLVFQGNIPEESTIRLMIGTRESCLDATRQALNEAKASLIPTPVKKAPFVFIFESVSRYILLGRGAEQELKIIKEELGKDTRIAGIYTYGEQAQLRLLNYQGKTYFHNQTITVLVIGG